MKWARLGDFLLWKDKPAKIIGTTDCPVLIIEMLEPKCCPHCNGVLGKEQFSVIEHSPLFQQSANMMPTIQEDNSVRISEDE